MSVETKPIPEAAVSLKYMAWDVKRIANELEKFTKLFQVVVARIDEKGERMPF